MSELQDVQRKAFVLVGRGAEFDSSTSLGITRRHVDKYSLSGADVLHPVYGRDQVGVTADHDELVTIVLVGILEHLHGDIDICSLFLRHVEDAVSLVLACPDSTSHLFGFEFAEENRDEWKRFEGFQIANLAGSMRAVNQSGEVVDPAEVVGGPEKGEKPLDVEPFLGTILDSPVVEIEAVDVDDRSAEHRSSQTPDTKKQAAI